MGWNFQLEVLVVNPMASDYYSMTMASFPTTLGDLVFSYYQPSVMYNVIVQISCRQSLAPSWEITTKHGLQF